MPDPFIDATDISDYLGRDVTGDAGATLALEAACEICRTISGQDFNGGTATIALDGNGGDCLLLPQRPVTHAGTLIVNGVEETDFMVTADGRLLRGTAGGDPRPVFPVGRQNVTFSYGYGYGTVPADVRMVALSIASRIVVQGVAIEESLGDVRVKYAAAGMDLTTNEERVLRKYRVARSF